jgi:hypothetical protein
MPANGESRERLSQLLLRCGADLQKIIDATQGSLETFAEYVAGISALASGKHAALVVLTRTHPPLEAIVQTRRMLQARVPTLERALWIIYADSLTDPLAHESLRDIGQLDGPLLEAPIWLGPDAQRYLVISPLVQPQIEAALEKRVQSLAQANRLTSGTRALGNQRSSERPTVPAPAFPEDPPQRAPFATSRNALRTRFGAGSGGR